MTTAASHQPLMLEAPAPRPESAYRCRVCNTPTQFFFELPRIPAQDGRLWPSPEEARACPVGQIQLTFCPECALIQNDRFDPSIIRYDRAYDISLHHSPTYRAFIDDLIQTLVARCQLAGKTILEVGCGKGDFLKALCAASNCTAIGFDPTYLGGADIPGITIYRERFTADSFPDSADLVCCRHVINSLTDPLAIVRQMRDVIARVPGGHIYLETPHAAHTFAQGCIWNISYENASFFSESSVARLLELAGLEPLDIRPVFEGQYLGALAKPGDEAARSNSHDWRDHRNRLADAVSRFAAVYRATIDRWQSWIDGIRQTGRRAAAWGAGQRAINFLLTFNITPDQIPVVVDINSKRQGQYLPLTAQRVIAPEELPTHQPEVVLITNSTFESEIRRHLHELGIHCEITVL